MSTEEREFWIQVRRGLGIVSAAIRTHHDDDAFWQTFQRGINLIVRAIEYRWKLPHSSVRPIGQGQQSQEPPAEPFAQSSDRSEQPDGLQQRQHCDL